MKIWDSQNTCLLCLQIRKSHSQRDAFCKAFRRPGSYLGTCGVGFDSLDTSRSMTELQTSYPPSSSMIMAYGYYHKILIAVVTSHLVGDEECWDVHDQSRVTWELLHFIPLFESINRVHKITHAFIMRLCSQRYRILTRDFWGSGT